MKKARVHCFFCGHAVETGRAYYGARLRQSRMLGGGREIDRMFHADCFRHFERLGGRPLHGEQDYEVLDATMR